MKLKAEQPQSLSNYYREITALEFCASRLFVLLAVVFDVVVIVVGDCERLSLLGTVCLKVCLNSVVALHSCD